MTNNIAEGGNAQIIESVTKENDHKSKFCINHGTWKQFRIAYFRKYNPAAKIRMSRGRTVVGTISNNKPSLTLKEFDFWVTNGEAKSHSKNKSKFVLSYKRGSLNLYKIIPIGAVLVNTPNSTVRVRNISNKPNLISDLGLTKNSQVKRLGRVINIFFKEQGIKNRIQMAELSLENFNYRLLKVIYPSVSLFNFSLTKIDSAYSRFLRKNITIKQLIKHCFGFDSKKIVKLACSKIEETKSLDILVKIGILCKGLIPIDNYYPIIEKMNGAAYTGTSGHLGFNMNSFILIRKFLKDIKPRRRFKLILDEKGEAANNALDTAKMYAELKSNIGLTIDIPKGGWLELHNYFAREQRKIENPNKEIKYSDKFNEIDGLIIDELRIELPRDSYRLIDMGKEMNNCIASYGREAISGNAQLLAIYKENKLIYNVEIRNKKLMQFKGKFNAAADQKDQEKVIDILVKHDILNENKDKQDAEILMRYVAEPQYIAPNPARRIIIDDFIAAPPIAELVPF